MHFFDPQARLIIDYISEKKHYTIKRLNNTWYSRDIEWYDTINYQSIPIVPSYKLDAEFKDPLLTKLDEFKHKDFFC